MSAKDKIDLEIFKVITSTIIKAENLESMGDKLVQVLVSALGIKGSTIFALNPETAELEIMAASGLSMAYVNKGPLLAGKSISFEANREAVVISDISKTNRLQYPEYAKEEGIAAVVSVPITFHNRIIGALRLYHHEVWDVSEKDLDSIKVIASNIGVAMMYSRIMNALIAIKSTVSDIHSVWLEPKVE